MKRISLAWRLTLLLALPLLAITAFGLRGALEKRSHAEVFAWVRGNNEAFHQLGRLVYQLQKERGRSAVFIGTKGTRFARELPAQQEASSGELEKLRVVLPRADTTGHENKLNAALAALDQLSAKRTAIGSLGITAPESTAYFTQTIASLIDLMTALSHGMSGRLIDPEIAAGIGAYENFVRAKEQSGIERAVMGGVFSADKFAGETLTRFSKAVAAQEAFHSVFSGFATEEQLKRYAEVVRGAPVDAVAAMRQVAFEKSAAGGFGIDPTGWYDAITAKIDLMFEFEEYLAGQYQEKIQVRENEARVAFVAYSAVTLFVILGTGLFGAWVIRTVTGPLRLTIQTLTAGIDDIRGASAQVATASQHLAEGASEQAASLEETSASLEEITSMVRRNAESARRAKEQSAQTRAAADAGAADMEKMKASMTAIKSSSDAIAKIVKNIDEIAFQTNILALNAAVEAARAGEAGAGFAVVADEVRNLAQRSAAAARETAEKIEDAVAKSTGGVQVSDKVMGSLQEIIDKARSVDDLVGEIAAASNEQAQGIEQVNLAINQMDKVTQSNAASAEECASASQELSAQADAQDAPVAELRAIVGGVGASTHPVHPSLASIPRDTDQEFSLADVRLSAPRPVLVDVHSDGSPVLRRSDPHPASSAPTTLRP